MGKGIVLDRVEVRDEGFDPREFEGLTGITEFREGIDPEGVLSDPPPGVALDSGPSAQGRHEEGVRARIDAQASRRKLELFFGLMALATAKRVTLGELLDEFESDPQSLLTPLGATPAEMSVLAKELSGAAEQMETALDYLVFLSLINQEAVETVIQRMERVSGGELARIHILEGVDLDEEDREKLEGLFNEKGTMWFGCLHAALTK